MLNLYNQQYCPYDAKKTIKWKLRSLFHSKKETSTAIKVFSLPVPIVSFSAISPVPMVSSHLSPCPMVSSHHCALGIFFPYHPCPQGSLFPFPFSLSPISSRFLLSNVPMVSSNLYLCPHGFLSPLSSYLCMATASQSELAGVGRTNIIQKHSIGKYIIFLPLLTTGNHYRLNWPTILKVSSVGPTPPTSPSSPLPHQHRWEEAVSMQSMCFAFTWLVMLRIIFSGNFAWFSENNGQFIVDRDKH